MRNTQTLQNDAQESFQQDVLTLYQAQKDPSRKNSNFQTCIQHLEELHTDSVVAPRKESQQNTLASQKKAQLQILKLIEKHRQTLITSIREAMDSYHPDTHLACKIQLLLLRGISLRFEQYITKRDGQLLYFVYDHLMTDGDNHLLHKSAAKRLVTAQQLSAELNRVQRVDRRDESAFSFSDLAKKFISNQCFLLANAINSMNTSGQYLEQTSTLRGHIQSAIHDIRVITEATGPYILENQPLRKTIDTALLLITLSNFSQKLQEMRSRRAKQGTWIAGDGSSPDYCGNTKADRDVQYQRVLIALNKALLACRDAMQQLAAEKSDDKTPDTGKLSSSLETLKTTYQTVIGMIPDKNSKLRVELTEQARQLGDMPTGSAATPALSKNRPAADDELAVNKTRVCVSEQQAVTLPGNPFHKDQETLMQSSTCRKFFQELKTKLLAKNIGALAVASGAFNTASLQVSAPLQMAQTLLAAIPNPWVSAITTGALSVIQTRQQQVIQNQCEQVATQFSSLCDVDTLIDYLAYLFVSRHFQQIALFDPSSGDRHLPATAEAVADMLYKNIADVANTDCVLQEKAMLLMQLTRYSEANVTRTNSKICFFGDPSSKTSGKNIVDLIGKPGLCYLNERGNYIFHWNEYSEPEKYGFILVSGYEQIKAEGVGVTAQLIIDNDKVVTWTPPTILAPKKVLQHGDKEKIIRFAQHFAHHMGIRQEAPKPAESARASESTASPFTPESFLRLKADTKHVENEYRSRR